MPLVSKRKYEAKLEFPRGWGKGANQKTFCGRGMDIFWNNTEMAGIEKM